MQACYKWYSIPYRLRVVWRVLVNLDFFQDIINEKQHQYLCSNTLILPHVVSVFLIHFFSNNQRLQLLLVTGRKCNAKFNTSSYRSPIKNPREPRILAYMMAGFSISKVSGYQSLWFKFFPIYFPWTRRHHSTMKQTYWI